MHPLRLHVPVALVCAGLVAGISACGGGSHGVAGRSITLARFNALRLGTPEAVIRQKLGLPERRQNVVQYGFTHEEPRGQRCVYYRRRFPDAGDPWNRSDTFELCFAGSRLRYKWAYLAARA